MKSYIIYNSIMKTLLNETKSDISYEILLERKKISEISENIFKNNKLLSEEEKEEESVKHFIKVNTDDIVSLFSEDKITTFPTISFKKKQKGYIIKAISAKKPTLEAKEKISIENFELDNTHPESPISEEEVNEEIKKRSIDSFLHKVYRKPLFGDFVKINVETFYDNKLIDKEKNISFFLSSDSLHPELLEKILETDSGDKFTKEIIFGNDYQIEEYKNKNILYKVTINEVNEWKIDINSEEYLKIFSSVNKDLIRQREIRYKITSINSLLVKTKEKNLFNFNISEEFIKYKFNEYKKNKLKEDVGNDNKWLSFLIEKNKSNVLEKIYKNVQDDLILKFILKNFKINTENDKTLSPIERKINICEKIFNFLSENKLNL